MYTKYPDYIDPKKPHPEQDAVPDRKVSALLQACADHSGKEEH